MEQSDKNKLRMVKLIEYLITESDELHPVSIANILDYLKSEDISANRKTIYSDIEAINDHFMKVVTTKKSQNWYYCDERKFDLSEIQLIVSAIVSAGFIDSKTSDELIDKLYSQTSKHIAKEIKNNITIKNPSKHSNREVLLSIEYIISAIRQRKQIEYDYIKHDVSGKDISRRSKMTPVDLIYNDNYYYVVVAGVSNDDIKFYTIRVDRMKNVLISDTDSIAHNYNSNNYVKTHFQMWDGEIRRVELLIENGIVDSMMDRFGEGLIIKRIDDNHAIINVEVAISQAFYSWLVTFGDKVKILTKDVKIGFIQYIASIVSLYRDDEEE